MKPRKDAIENATWENLDITEDEVDHISRRNDRAFIKFKKRIKDSDQFKLEGNVFDNATYAALYKLVQEGLLSALRQLFPRSRPARQCRT